MVHIRTITRASARTLMTIYIIDFGPLSITVVGRKLLSNEMAGVGAGDLVWSNRWRILYHFLHQSTRGFLWNISRALFAILWRILRNFCEFDILRFVKFTNFVMIVSEFGILNMPSLHQMFELCFGEKIP